MEWWMPLILIMPVVMYRLSLWLDFRKILKTAPKESTMKVYWTGDCFAWHPAYDPVKWCPEELVSSLRELTWQEVRINKVLLYMIGPYIYWLIYLPFGSLNIGFGWYSFSMIFILGIMGFLLNNISNPKRNKYITTIKLIGEIFIYGAGVIVMCFILTILGFIWYYFCGGGFIGLFDDIFTNVAIGALSIFLILYVAVGLLGLFR